MKVLVISHVSPLSPYGAATSIKSHIECIEEEIDVEIFYNENFPTRRDSYFPFKIWPNYAFFSGGTAKRFVYRLRSGLVSLFNLNVIDCSKYDLIHLNSLVLLRNVVDMLSVLNGVKPHIVFHVREILDVNKVEAIDRRNLDLADLFICVDSVTERALLSIDENLNTVIITNPVKVNLIDLNPSYEYLVEKLKFKKVFAIIGTITPDKGVDFVLRAFERLPTDCCLMVIGDNSSFYARSILEKYLSNNNIYAVGEVGDVSGSGIYRLIDVLLRAEEFFCVGRTTIEALYSGINVLQPCELEERDNNDLTELSDGGLLHYYIPRNVDSFVSAIDNIDFSRAASYSGSNFSAYKENVMMAYESIS